MTLTQTEQERLADIRTKIEMFRARGVDVSTWNDEFFLNLIQKLKGAKDEK